MTEKQKVKALHILNHYETRKQMLKCVEELSELIEAIMKHINKGGNEAAVFEEIADVEIMLAQMKAALPYGENIFEEEIDRKLDRQLARIRGEDELNNIPWYEKDGKEMTDCQW